MRALAAEVIDAGDRERAAVARELHDSTAQRLAGLQLQLSSAARDANAIDGDLAYRLNDARDATRGILEEIRNISHAMHPSALDDLGLEAALRGLARDASHGNGIDIDVNADAVRVRLPAAVEKVFYRVSQEALRNAVAHGMPTEISIRVYRDSSSALLEIHDNGRGFDSTEAGTRGTGLGLLSMQERAELIGGHVEIRTALGSGTTILATVPLDTVANPIILDAQ